MSLSDLATLGSFVSGVAVLATVLSLSGASGPKARGIAA
jgi:hypothetical protein